MAGGVGFREALEARLGIIQPTASGMDAFLSARPPRLSPGVGRLVAALRARGTEVYLVSGGFRQMIHPVADLLGLPRGNVFANTVLFDEAGRYAGFDREEFTSRAGGKAEALRHLQAERGHAELVMVGDGATDLEARQEGGASAFVAYGGNVTREAVALAADWFVLDFQELIQALH